MLRFMLNGVLVCGAILVAQIAVGAPCAYALARLRFSGRKILFGLILVAMLIPHQVLAVPLFVLLNRARLLNTYAALILPSVASPLAIFLLRQTFKMIPANLVNAARLDGLGELSIVWRIMIPLALPTIAAVGILSVVSHWNDLFWPLIVIHHDTLATPPLGIARFRSQEAGNDYGPLMAGAVVITIPLIAAFLLAQRRFIDGPDREQHEMISVCTVSLASVALPVSLARTLTLTVTAAPSIFRTHV
jgi:multiple sugar transport system permease protein